MWLSIQTENGWVAQEFKAGLMDQTLVTLDPTSESVYFDTKEECLTFVRMQSVSIFINETKEEIVKLAKVWRSAPCGGDAELCELNDKLEELEEQEKELKDLQWFLTR